ncbi:Hypothetical predicted protein [Cloeon dipterum]|uniref:Uncharacterized protein n=1 Tax=Cloeon dipterum TaxID=197152 RepID=A0A8S1D378_9INSE|nr:Hypothetical predicted protein [Cloeon dipterum]
MEENSGGWRAVLTTRGVDRFQGRGRLMRTPSNLHAEPPGVHFESTTFYQKNYPGHEIKEDSVQKPVKRADMLGLSDKKVDGVSIYAQDYPKYPGAASAQLRPNKTNLHPLSGQAVSETSYSREFVGFDGAYSDRTELIRKRDNLHPSDAKLEGHSVTASDFR